MQLNFEYCSVVELYYTLEVFQSEQLHVVQIFHSHSLRHVACCEHETNSIELFKKLST